MPWQNSIRYLLTSDEKRNCFAAAGHEQQHSTGPACYLLEAVNLDTGEVRRVCACCAHASWWCYRSGIADQWAALTVPDRAQLAYPIPGPRRPAYVLPPLTRSTA